MILTHKRDYAQLKRNIPLQILIRKLLPDGKKQGKEWIALNPTRSDDKNGSFKVNLNNGLWSDFATGDKGDIIDLYAYINRCDINSAYDALAFMYKNYSPPPIKPKPAETKLIFPVPDDAPPLPKDNRVMQWEYRNENNELLFYVARYHWVDGRKYICPFTYREDAKGNRSWEKKGLGDLPRPLYNIPRLISNKLSRVLIVEGEKTADAAQRLLPDLICITWQGGANTVHQVDFSLLANREVICWPDNDDDGVKAMNAVKSKLLNARVIDLKLIGNKPNKWDLANAEKEGATQLDLMKIINKIDDTKEFKFIYSDDFPDLSEKGRPINTSDNVAYLLKKYDIQLRYNLMTNYPEFFAPNKKFSTVNQADCFFTEISNLCVKNGVPKVDLGQHIIYISDSQRYHPAIDFINSKPWDGISRINDLFKTIKADNQQMANKLIYRWLIGCVAAAFSDNGVSLEGILVFQGKQKIGKSYWFIKLVPEKYQYLIKTSLSLDPRNKDDVMDCTSCWLGELAEIDGTIKKSEVSAQKSFITKSIDYYRVPFGKHIRSVPRRTSFFGSVNPTQFLSDETGNRRFWSIAVQSINYDHTIDMQQLWAEIKTLLDGGETYRLTDEEQDFVNNENESFLSPPDPLEEAIIERYRWDEEERNHSRTVGEVLRDLGFTLPEMRTQGMSRKCGEILSRLTGKKMRRSDGKKVYDLPRLKPF